MKPIYFTRVLIALSLSLIPAAFGQGSLTPPPGIPAPTMKSLDQIEPRKLISSLPFFISTSGSYYLATNLTGSSGSDGISINANNVTLDLNGFTLTGPASGTTENGISGSSSASNFVIMHGIIRGWPRSGVLCSSSADCRVRDLTAISNGFSGILLGDTALVEQCTTDHNGLINSGQAGISVGQGSTIRDCIVTGQNGPSSEGIRGGGACVIEHCTITANNSTGGANGVDANGGSLIVDCVISKNRGDTNFTAVFANSGTRVKNCIVNGNSGDGIRVEDNCTIADNDCSNNDGVGINVLGVGSRIDNNHVAANGAQGIKLSTANSSVVVRNTTTGNGAANLPATGSNIGPIQSPATATGPWANFSF